MTGGADGAGAGARDRAAAAVTRETKTPGRIAIVTGASGGVGALVALDLARDHHVIAAGRDHDALERLAAGRDIQAVTGDLTRPGVAGALAGRAGRLDVLVHCAAVAEPGRLEDIDADEWRRQYEINVVAAAELTRLALPALRAARGTVVFINSGSGLRASADSPVYAATKHALRALADSLRLAEAANLVRVTSIFPGPIDTAMQHVLRRRLGEPYLAERYLTPEEVARAVRFAISASPETDVTEIHLRPRSEASPPPQGKDWAAANAGPPALREYGGAAPLGQDEGTSADDAADTDEFTETAVVGRWKPDKGYGWAVTPRRRIVWIHFSAIETSGFADLNEGDLLDVRYIKARQDTYDWRATWVRLRRPAG